MDILKRLLGAVLMVVVMFVGAVIITKLVADAFSALVLWTAKIWGMEYR